ncbi:hypothetical protein C9374_004917 [Naegleria lovaniensis]|uniref:Uncharacterized protein n=1 Tax=Naegleria lovaniensis TaxID=51637 RepID=A0AA88GRW2_NAELO|nr:uncharacterized protein C9374_004917 [Naegleria lovaniensis]KAG2382950.1 hypothetical protein C9374_004917 [Naegleria lovaniensis]
MPITNILNNISTIRFFQYLYLLLIYSSIFLPFLNTSAFLSGFVTTNNFVKICNSKNNLISCKNTFVIGLNIGDEGLKQDLKIHVSPDQPIPLDPQDTDSHSSYWTVTSDVVIQIERSDVYVHFPLKYVGSLRNAFEDYQIQSQSCRDERRLSATATSTMTTMINGICCGPLLNADTGQVYYETRRILYNSTIYSQYTVGTPSLQYSIFITLRQGDLSFGVSLTNEQRSVSTRGMTVSLESEMLFDLRELDFREYYYVIPEKQNIGFLVPKQHIGNEMNKIGISTEIYLRNIDCFYQKGSLLRIQGALLSNDPASYNDQFYPFRNIKLLYKNSNCYYYNRYTGKIVYFCDKTLGTTMIFELPFGDGTFSLTKLKGNPVIVSKGAFRNDQTVSVSLDIFNNIETPGLIDVTLLDCCSTDLSCNKTQRQYTQPRIEGFDVKKIIFNTFLTLSRGKCILQVGDNGNIMSTIEIPFAFEDSSTTVNEDFCKGPYQKTIIDNGNVKCEANCQHSDLVFDSTQKICVPLNCSEKYDNKTVFNYASLSCEVPVHCDLTTQQYNSHNNTCQPKQGNLQATSDAILNSANFKDKMLKLNCGNGLQTSSGIMCMCSGQYISYWSNTTTRLALVTPLCSIDSSKQETSEDDSRSNDFFSSFMGIPVVAQIVAIVCTFALVTGVLLLLSMCITCCCFKRKTVEKALIEHRYGNLKRKRFLKWLSGAVLFCDFSREEYSFESCPGDNLKVMSTFNSKKMKL